VKSLLLVVVASTALLTSACGGSGASTCGAPNTTQGCVCSDGASGAQTCQADGAWSNCQCGAVTDTIGGDASGDTTATDTGGSPRSGIAAIQSSAASVSCDPDEITDVQSGVTLSNVVVMTEKITINANLVGYYVSDQTQEPNSGILVVLPKSHPDAYHYGERVDVTGDHVEFYCQTQLDADSVTRLGAIAPPAPVAIAKNLTAAELERWEGVFVELSDVTVTGTDSFGQGQTDAGVLIDFAAGEGITIPSAGTVLTALRGFVTYSYGSYRVSPRGDDDLVVACTGSCEGKSCGDDGCGQSCGTCSGELTVCSDAGACVNSFAGDYGGGRFNMTGGCSGDLVVKVRDTGYVTLAGPTTSNARCDGGGVQLYLNPHGDPDAALRISAPNVISGNIDVQVEAGGWGSGFTCGVQATISETGAVDGTFTGLPKTVTLGSGQSITISSGWIQAPWPQ